MQVDDTEEPQQQCIQQPIPQQQQYIPQQLQTKKSKVFQFLEREALEGKTSVSQIRIRLAQLQNK
jgi:hypothetical protein